MTNDCKTCPVSTGTHQPAEALHQIAEPDAQHLQELAAYRFTVENLRERVAELEAERTARMTQNDRMAERIAELEAELEAVGAGGVQRLAAAPQAVQAAVPDGWQMVPAKPTEAMVGAIMSEGEVDAVAGLAPELRPILLERAGIAARYTAMLAAAPAHPAEAVPAQAGPVGYVALAALTSRTHADDYAKCFATEAALLENYPAAKAIAVFDHAATQPAAQGMDADGMYYLQDARHHAMVGNCPSFWRPDGNGYTTNLDEAARFTFEDAMQQHQRRKTDLPWLCSEVDKLRRPTVDCQDMPRSWDAQRAALAAQAKQGGA